MIIKIEILMRISRMKKEYNNNWYVGEDYVDDNS